MARLPDEAPSAALRRLINGYQVSQAIHVATVLDIPELLAEGPRTPDELAAATDSNGNALRRLLRALAAIGVFHEDAVDRFSLTPVGDGLGTFLSALLAAYQSLHGVLFDQPHVVDGAEELLRAAGLADRCRIVSGSFFDEVPRGADAYLLKSILRDWDDEGAAAIFRTCRRAVG